MIGQLRETQAADVEKILRNKKVYIGSEPGTGKTVTVLAAAERSGIKTILIFGTKNTFGTWQHEINKFIPGNDSVIYTGTPKQREKCWQRFAELKTPMRFLITNFEQAQEIFERQSYWPFMALDEVHNSGLFNCKNKTWKIFSKAECEFFIPMTGTPIRKGPQDLYGLLGLCNKMRYGTYWQFVYRHCVVIKDTFGISIEGRPKNPMAFKELIAPNFVRHTKKEVANEMPAKSRVPIPVYLNGNHEKYYRELEENWLVEMGDDLILAPNTLTLNLRLRQFLICPQILGFDEPGCLLEAMADRIMENFYTEDAIVIATPFKAATKCIVDYLTERYRQEFDSSLASYVIHGDIKEPARTVADRFQEHKGKRILVLTIKSGTSYDAFAAHTMYFLGYEWSAIQNEQAEDRIHRIGQTVPVVINYMLGKGTIDEAVMDKLDNKQAAANWVLDTKAVMARIKELQRQRLEGQL